MPSCGIFERIYLIFFERTFIRLYWYSNVSIAWLLDTIVRAKFYSNWGYIWTKYPIWKFNIHPANITSYKWVSDIVIRKLFWVVSTDSFIFSFIFVLTCLWLLCIIMTWFSKCCIWRKKSWDTECCTRIFQVVALTLKTKHMHMFNFSGGFKVL